ncbi:MAG: ParA family protein [Pseudomonadales bacterium]
MIRVIFNQKGGVGKSSIAANLAAISAAEGHSTLLIDLDYQCNSSQYLLGAEQPHEENTIADFFSKSLKMGGKRSTEHYITETSFPNLHVIASHPELAEIQSRLEAKHKIYKFRDLITKLTDSYDRIYIDTPPAFNFYTLSALIAADTVFIPFDCDDFSRQALYTLLENLEETRDDHNENLDLGGIIVNQFLPRANHPQRIVNELRAEKLPLFNTLLGSSVKMHESHEISTPLIYMAPNHKLTLQFVELHQEIEKKRRKKR